MVVHAVLTKDTTTRRLRVLVVEDDQSVSRMLRLSLSAAGSEITEMSTGGDALRVLDYVEVDAVVLDLGLPVRLSGRLLDRLQTGTASPSPALVAISALDAQEATSRYGPLRHHFMSKSFDPWDLVRLIKGQPGIDLGTSRPVRLLDPPATSSRFLDAVRAAALAPHGAYPALCPNHPAGRPPGTSCSGPVF
jgi:CheY-like chemotaxis protein